LGTQRSLLRRWPTRAHSLERQHGPVWDAQTGKEITRLEGHTGHLNSAVFSPDGRRVLTASNDNTARIWDAQTGIEITRLEGHEEDVTSAVFSPDGQHVLTAQIWSIFPTTQALVDEARGRVPRCLTSEQRRKAFIDLNPLEWCVDAQKWPNHTQDWHDWLRYKREGSNPPRPGSSEWNSWVAARTTSLSEKGKHP
jgi:dipeptidyl aminopeptidase/acylaminoacyl peptidase